VPAFNEEEGLPVVLERILAAVDAGYEVLVVDDGSTDATRRIAEGYPCRVFSHATNRGKAEAMRTGIREARGENVIFIDADDTYPAELIPRLAAALRDCDMVVGSRSGSSANIPAFNRIGNAIFRNSIRYLYGFGAYDPLTGFYGLKKRHLERMQLVSDGFRIESEIAIKAARMGLRVSDIPIEYGPRRGQAKLRGLRDGYAIFLTIVTMLPLFAPTFAFVLPGFLLGAAGLITMALLYGGDGSTNGYVLAAFLGLTGVQLVFSGLALDFYASAHRFTRLGPLARLLLTDGARLTLALGGIVLALGGCAWLIGGAEGKQFVTAAFAASLGLLTLSAAAYLTVFATAARSRTEAGESLTSAGSVVAAGKRRNDPR
jgi:glycosyltransferase involved in cell wall biosynthesis